MRTPIIIIALLLVAAADVAAQAHAFLEHASPLVGSTVAAAPRQVTLTFTQNLESAFSSVQITNAHGSRVDQGKAEISGNTMRIGLKPLIPGPYKVRWRALSSDKHKTEGSFSFRVGTP